MAIIGPCNARGPPEANFLSNRPIFPSTDWSCERERAWKVDEEICGGPNIMKHDWRRPRSICGGYTHLIWASTLRRPNTIALTRFGKILSSPRSSRLTFFLRQQMRQDVFQSYLSLISRIALKRQISRLFSPPAASSRISVWSCRISLSRFYSCFSYRTSTSFFIMFHTSIRPST